MPTIEPTKVMANMLALVEKEKTKNEKFCTRSFSTFIQVSKKFTNVLSSELASYRKRKFDYQLLILSWILVIIYFRAVGRCVPRNDEDNPQRMSSLGFQRFPS